MLLSEFIERTGVQPTAEEYAKIEAEYYEFPGDKDAFCKAWKKANPAAVRKAKEAKMKAKKDSELFKFWCILDKYQQPYSYKASDVISAQGRELLKEFGIKFDENDYLGDVNYMIYNYFHN